ncbi:MAG TPA: hypothetical protein P5571_15290 [Candidatus Krumholzibacteria bacterium]|nr:hypothetical protein [Candidatus Krumholzibacteria bacterium]HRX52733.1 hypothetical protein [Candidatus Krumholzibacteria bacterium]
MKRSLVFFILLILALALFGCGRETDQTAPAVTSAAKYDLGDQQDILETLEYEVFTGTIQEGVGGWLTGTMTTWPKNCTFGVMVPPTAVPVGLGSTTFTMRIPTYQSYMDHAADDLPLIVRLEPSSINFQAPVSVMATYMPWTGMTAEDVFEYWSVSPDYLNYGAPSSVTQVGNRVRIVFEVPHFSDWELGPPD